MLLTWSSEMIGSVEALALRQDSIASFPSTSRGYHYGASESNVTYPEGELARIKLKADRGSYKGIGTIADALDETTLLTGKRLGAQAGIVQGMLDALVEAGKGDYKVAKVITLFNPIKLFVLLSNGNEDEDIVYMSINGRSNGSGQRKEINWPAGVSKSSKGGWEAYIARQLATEQRNLRREEKRANNIISGKVAEDFTGELGYVQRNILWIKENLLRVEASAKAGKWVSREEAIRSLA